MINKIKIYPTGLQQKIKHSNKESNALLFKKWGKQAPEIQSDPTKPHGTILSSNKSDGLN